MASAHFDWQKQSETRGDHRQVVEGYKIVDAMTRAAAYTATGFPAHNQVLASDTTFRVRTRNVAGGEGPTAYVGTVTYEQGDWSSTEDDNPLARPAIISWGRGFTQDGRDRDAAGVLIANANGDLFEPQVGIPEHTLSFRIRRNEAFYDFDHYRSFIGAVNSAPFAFTTGTTIQVGECLCTNIIPAGEYSSTADYVEMAFEFELKRDPKGDGTGWPWDEHIVNDGLYGYCADGKGPFVTANNDLIEKPVLLDATGKPFDTAVKVRSPTSKKSSTATANPSSAQHITGERLSATSTATTIYIRVKRHLPQNFATMGLSV